MWVKGELPHSFEAIAKMPREERIRASYEHMCAEARRREIKIDLTLEEWRELFTCAEKAFEETK